MSAMGHKRTFALRKRTSALPSKADMCGVTGDVRFGPIADMDTYSITSSTCEQHWGYGQADGLGGLEVDNELELGGLLHR
jgi:hypothetical protein